MNEPSQFAPEIEPLHRGLITIKGVIWFEDRVLLLKNRRGEWELPGGKRDSGESFADCLEREVQEETLLTVEAGPLLAAHPHHWYINVVELIYGCYPRPFSDVTHTEEHRGIGRFAVSELTSMSMPPTTRAAIELWANDARSRRTI